MLFLFPHTFFRDSSSFSFHLSPLSFLILSSHGSSKPFLLCVCGSAGECNKNDGGDGDKGDDDRNGHGCNGHSVRLVSPGEHEAKKDTLGEHIPSVDCIQGFHIKTLAAASPKPDIVSIVLLNR